MRFTFIILMFFLALQISAQNLPTPEILSVSVDTVTGRPVVKWQIDDPSLIDGYVVKRLIYDGVGVMPDTYNNVAVIDNPLTTVWEDNSTDYSTFADPENRIEIYRVAAFVNDGAQKKYSLMSDEMSTMQIFAEYDKCSNSFNISSTYIKGVTPDFYYFRSGNGGAGERFIVELPSNNPDGMIHLEPQKFDEHFSNRTFSVEAVFSNGLSAFSPIITLVVPEVKIPDVMSVESVSVNANNHLVVTANVSASEDIKKTYLYRLSYADVNDIQQFDLPVSTNGEMAFEDVSADPNLYYDYHIEVVGECDTPLAQSQGTRNVVLEAREADANSNYLTWNNQNIFNRGDIISTSVYRIDDAGNKTLVDNVSGHYNDFTDMLSNIIANSTNYSGKFCYQVECLEGNANKAHTSYSNIACIDRQPVVFVPNAINPDADQIDNRYFRPKGDFFNDYKMDIFNKRGELLFSSTDYEQGWDGRNNSGRLYPPDAYVYLITFKTSSGEQKRLSGFVNLVYKQ